MLLLHFSRTERIMINPKTFGDATGLLPAPNTDGWSSEFRCRFVPESFVVVTDPKSRTTRQPYTPPN